jgi:hypothetical protein
MAVTAMADAQTRAINNQLKAVAARVTKTTMDGASNDDDYDNDGNGGGGGGDGDGDGGRQWRWAL